MPLNCLRTPTPTALFYFAQRARESVLPMVSGRGDHGVPRLRLSHDVPPPLQLFRHRLQLLHQLLRHAL